MTTDDIDRFAARVMTAVYVADVQAVIREAIAEARRPFLDLADRLDDQSPHLELPRGHVADMIRSVARNAP